MYVDILTFMPKHCTLLVSIMSRGFPSEGYTSSMKGFDFLVNSVWPEVVSLIEQKIPMIFAPGNPDTFHQVSGSLDAHNYRDHVICGLGLV